jgi:hypothetical protein
MWNFEYSRLLLSKLAIFYSIFLSFTHFPESYKMHCAPNRSYQLSLPICLSSVYGVSEFSPVSKVNTQIIWKMVLNIPEYNQGENRHIPRIKISLLIISFLHLTNISMVLGLKVQWAMQYLPLGNWWSGRSRKENGIIICEEGCPGGTGQQTREQIEALPSKEQLCHSPCRSPSQNIS